MYGKHLFVIGIAVVCCSFASGCARWVLRDFSRPVAMENGKPTLGKKPVGLKLVPPGDLQFEVTDQKTGFTVTLLSKNWALEGCGTGTGNGELVIHSVCGIKDPAGGRLVHREPGSRADYRIFFEDSGGKRHAIP